MTSTAMTRRSNGNPPPALPDERQAAVEAGLAQFQAIAAERDQLTRDVHRLNSELAAARVEVEAHTARLADMESRAATAMIVRDQAVADRAMYETLFISVQAQLRAFAVPAAPLVRGANETGNESDEQRGAMAGESDA